MNDKNKYSIFDDGRRLPSGGPLVGEFYDSAWQIQLEDASCYGTPVVLIMDPGDGSAEPLARRIMELLNSGELMRSDNLSHVDQR